MQISGVHLWLILWKAFDAVREHAERHIESLGLCLSDFGVLEALLHKGPLTHRELGRKVLTSAGNMTDVVDKLEARGLVRRVRGTADRRQVRVELTDAGRAMIEHVFPRHAEDIARAMSGLDGAELRALGELLRRLGMAATQSAAEPATLAIVEPAH